MLARTTGSLAAAIAAALSLSPAAAGPALLFDAADGRVLYAEDADNQWHPASLTKIMTAYLTFEAIKQGKLTLETRIACSEIASSQGPTKLGLAPGGSHYGRDGAAGAHHQVGQRRGGDAGRGGGRIARGVRGADERHRRAPRHDAHQVRQRQRPAGARADLHRARPGRLSAAVVRDYPEYAHMWAMLDAKVGKRHLRSHNGLLTNYAGADGLKTGFICDSGFNVVASATRDGRKMIAVVLGEATGGERSARAANLLEHGFQTYEWKALFAPPTLETMPMAEDAKGPMTIRQLVRSYVCGTGGRRAVAKAKRKKGQAVSEQQPRRRPRSGHARPPAAAPSPQ